MLVCRKLKGEGEAGGIDREGVNREPRIIHVHKMSHVHFIIHAGISVMRQQNLICSLATLKNNHPTLNLQLERLE